MSDAKYTEYLSDYLSHGYELPADFGLIDGFDDLFVGHYIDREIGFETEDLFEVKLASKAALVMPVYATRLAQLNAAMEQAANAARVVSEQGSETEDVTTGRNYTDEVNAGAQHGSVTELPLMAGAPASYEVEPNRIQDQDAFTNTSAHDESVTDDRDRTHQYTRTERGTMPTEAWAIVRDLESEVYNLKLRCLREYNGLFMGVF